LFVLFIFYPFGEQRCKLYIHDREVITVNDIRVNVYKMKRQGVRDVKNQLTIHTYVTCFSGRMPLLAVSLIMLPVYGVKSTLQPNWTEWDEMMFAGQTRVRQRTTVFVAGAWQNGASWRMQLNCPCAAAMRLFVQLLWPVVVIIMKYLSYVVILAPKTNKIHLGV